MAHRVTLIPGDGIGPELAEASRRVLDASGVEFEWEVVDAGEGVMAEYGTPLPEHVLESITRNKVALKGPITTPVGEGRAVGRDHRLAGVHDLPLEVDARGVEDAAGRLRQLRADPVAGDEGDSMGHDGHSSHASRRRRQAGRPVSDGRLGATRRAESAATIGTP